MTCKSYKPDNPKNETQHSFLPSELQHPSRGTGQSAGGLNKKNVGSSETIRKRTMQPTTPISVHRPRARRGVNDHEIGSFLAGLIDSDGHWSAIPQLVISFDSRESSLAHYVKKTIGYGRVYPAKGKNALKYVCAHRDGLRKVALLCSPYLRHPDKWADYDSRCRTALQLEKTPLSTLSLKQDWWLAGFFVGDGSISCQLVERPQRLLESRFLMGIHQEKKALLDLIKGEFGGCISYGASQDTYYYSSVSYKNALSWINYLDKAFLMGVKMTTYVVWRRAFLLVQEKRHRTPPGESKLRRMCKQITARGRGEIG